MTKFYQNKKNKQTYKATKMASGILLENVVSDERKTIAESTLHRYYEEVQPVQPTKKPLPPADVIRELTQKRTKQTNAVAKQPKQTKQAEQPKQPKQPKQLVADKTNKYPYYRHYERNQKPLWNTVVEDNALYCCNEAGDKLIKCTLSKTAVCIRIEQVATKAKRYFTNFNRAKRHLVYDQDIKTTQYIGEKFDKWLKAQQKRIIEGDK